MSKENTKSRRSYRKAGISLSFTVLIIAAAILLNVLTDLLDSRYSLRLDLTQDKAFGVSEETKEFLASLEGDIQISVLNTEQSFTAGEAYFLQAAQVLKEYDRLSDKVTLRFVDIIKEPTYVARYPQLSLTSNDILVESGNNRKKLTVYDLFDIQINYYTGDYAIVSSMAEQALTGALMSVTSEISVNTAVLTGFGETDVSSFQETLSTGSFTVSELSLLTQDIPANVDTAILAAPARDLDESALDKLDAFLSRPGTTLLYFAGAEQPALPEMEAFLAQWGIGIGEGVVFEQDQARTINYNPYFALLDYSDQTVGAELLQRGLYTAVPLSRPLTLLSVPEDYYAQAMLSFSQSGGIYPPDAGEDWTPRAQDLREYIPGIIKSTRTTGACETAVQSSVIVCASVEAVSQALLQSTSIGNADYFPALLLASAGQEQSFHVSPKTLGGTELGVTSSQITLLMLIFVIAIPLITIIAGIAVYLGRRHR